MEIYSGLISENGEACVTCSWDEKKLSLPLRLDLANHSPTGFSWGYLGSGPTQLSLAILAHHLKNDKQALDLYQQFKFDVIAGLPENTPWQITADQIDAWVLQNSPT